MFFKRLLLSNTKRLKENVEHLFRVDPAGDGDQADLLRCLSQMLASQRQIAVMIHDLEEVKEVLVSHLKMVTLSRARNQRSFFLRIAAQFGEFRLQSAQERFEALFCFAGHGANAGPLCQTYCGRHDIHLVDEHKASRI